MSATTLVIASSASASCNEECKAQKEKEKAAAKKLKEEEKEAKIREKREASGIGDPWGVNDFHAYKYCPYESAASQEISDCFTGITAGGKQGGFFQYGKVKVNLDKSIRLQGAFSGVSPNLKVFPAAHGGETLEAPLLDVEGGISVITEQIQKEAKWPQALIEGFNQAKKNKEGTINVKIEMAGNECFEVVGCLNTEAIILEKGTAFKLPLKVKVTGPFLEKLGGGPCYIGSDENPIHINLTTEGQGAAGEVLFNEEFTNIFLENTRLVDFGWHIPVVSGAKGCGGEFESYVDKALNIALEVESPGGEEVKGRKGMVVLQGDLHDANGNATAEEAEKGRV